MRKNSKGDPLRCCMSVEVEPLESEQEDHGVLPFRLRDINPLFSFSGIHPLAQPIDTVQAELRFQSKLALHEWDKEYWITLSIGLFGFILGSLSSELLSGGNTQQFGFDGLTSVRGFAFFQMLISLICWGIFAMQVWRLFPVMRIHALSLLVLWNITMLAQILFHQNHIDFPTGLVLGDMMGGTLAILIVLFFIYYFGKAVVETRDLHVEEYHVHEDVRLMELEMAEHSLRGWGFLLASWFVLIFVSTWAGAHFVSERGGERIGSLSLHMVTGLLSLPLFMALIWYPQRMLGTGVQVTTNAAIKAQQEMGSVLVTSTEQASQCPDCETPVPVHRNEEGVLVIPCPSEGCSQMNEVGTSCSTCLALTPSRYDCPQCGINAPALDFVSDMEAW